MHNFLPLRYPDISINPKTQCSEVQNVTLNCYVFIYFLKCDILKYFHQNKLTFRKPLDINNKIK